MEGGRRIIQKSQDFVAFALWQEGGMETVLASQFQHPYSEDGDPSPFHRADFLYKGPYKLQGATQTSFLIPM